MCILFIYMNPNPSKGKYRLILASNRDESYARPAKPIHRWQEDTNVVGGRDMTSGREGGTWLALSVRSATEFRFRVAALLNLTGEPKVADPLGRGPIVADYVTGSLKAEDYIAKLSAKRDQYNSFCTAIVEISTNLDVTTYHYSNAATMNEPAVFKSPDFLCFGNSLAEKPLVKVEKGKEEFRKLVEKYDDTEHKQTLVDELVKLLKWDKRHLPDEELLKRVPKGYEPLSAVFVSVPSIGYGTRTHTVILVDDEGFVDCVEYTMDEPIDVQNPKWVKRHIELHL